MKKIQSFYILKLSSRRIRNSKYKINLDFNQARKNGEIISVAQNQVIESLFKLQGKDFDQNVLKYSPHYFGSVEALITHARGLYP